MEEITLCLRQEDSVQVDRNGVYTTTLSHPVELRDGDVVSIKSVFLDTQDVISVPVEGLPIELRGCKYLVNYNIICYIELVTQFMIMLLALFVHISRHRNR